MQIKHCLQAKTHSFSLQKTLLYWISCDVFISCLDSHSDGTHSLQRIHWWASDVMLHFSKSFLIKKQTHLHLGWPECIFKKFKFWDEQLKLWTMALLSEPSFQRAKMSLHPSITFSQDILFFGPSLLFFHSEVLNLSKHRHMFNIPASAQCSWKSPLSIHTLNGGCSSALGLYPLHISASFDAFL